MSELLKRFLTGLIAGGVATTAIVISPWGLFTFGVIVSMVGLWEFFKITNLLGKRVPWIAMGFGILIWAYFLLYFVELTAPLRAFVEFVELNWAVLTSAALGLISMGALFDKKEENAVRTMGLIFGGFFYAFMPMAIYFMLGISPWARTEIGAVDAAGSYNFQYPLGLLFLHWLLDVMAYFGGRFFGRKPLFPRISPKKTWAGAIIGAIFCIGFGVVLEFWFDDVHWNWIVVAAVVSVLSQLGDLLESMYKRSLDIKDSGGILPGHGGFLDRFDGMYLTVPVLYLYLFGVYALAY